MAYSNFNKVSNALNQFKLDHQKSSFFPVLAPVEPTSWLKETLRTALKTNLISEKERSEKLVNPILLELTKRNDYQLTVYSGRELNVDPAIGLNGECDFLISWSTLYEDVEAPLFTVVEAKKNDLEYGTAQCIAQMVGAKLFNQSSGIDTQKLYGASTNGKEWRFLKLEGDTVYFNYDDFGIANLQQLLAVLQFIVEDCRILQPSLA